ncbi:imm11 family protein [Novipirellula sp. SH528]|uniref:imm11 family protein n=1 Tax=Novipirellula sp. SH528 TaxID=3454466 RepID=UPI003FA01DA2
MKPILNDPTYEGFGFGDAPSLTTPHRRVYDFTHFYPTKFNYTIPSLKRKWDNPVLDEQDKVAPFNDFPCCDFYVPVFSARAVDVLREFLAPNGELLPVRTSRGQYMAYQTRAIAEGILNVSRTVGDLRDNVPLFSDITKYAFYKSKLGGLTIFRVREDPSPVLVTNAFKDAVERNGLNGFNLIRVWPHPTPREAAAEKQKRKQRSKIKINGKMRGRQEKTIILILPLKDKAPSASEQKAIDRLRAILNERLVLKHPGDEYYGSTEGYELSKRRYRLLISCPDADWLLGHLARSIRGINWGVPITVAIRDSEFWDSGAPESVIDLNGIE